MIEQRTRAVRPWTTALVVASHVIGEYIRVPLVRQALAVPKNPYQWFKSSQHVLNTPEGLPLLNLADSQFLGNITVGSPAQTLTVSFSTDSSDTWFVSTACDTAACREHKRYAPSDSSTHRRNGSAFKSSSEWGVAKGFLSVDTIQLGNVEVESQLFGEVDEAPVGFWRPKFDGVVGMGVANVSSNGIPSLFHRAVNQGLLDEPVFSLYLKMGDLSNTSEIILGGSDSSLYQPPMTKLNLIEDATHWDVALDSFTFANDTLAPKDWHVRFNSFDSVIGMPSDLFAYLSAQLPQPAELCQYRETAPDLILRLHGHDFAVPPSHYIYEVRGYCFAAFAANEMELDTRPRIDLGLPFLTRWYSSYNIEEKTVNLAAAL